MININDILNSYVVDESWQRAFYEFMHTTPELSMQEEETHQRLLAELTQFCLLYTSPSPRD